MADINNVLMDNYLPYAEYTIIDRAIPFIDGFKPSGRRIMYAMNNLKLDGKMCKSARITGDVMGKYHPHGDEGIYETMVRMTDKYCALNIGYVKGDGSFGAVYNSGKDWAAPRYTEAGLAPISRELFEGLNEDAVNMVPNFDGTEKEPVLLPVKFPTILVNPSSGMAVGMSSSIPAFGLKEVCEATIGIIEKKINTNQELVSVIGVPEYKTGGFVHVGDGELEKLIETGCGSVIMSGNTEVHDDRLVITELPHGVTIEDVLDKVDEMIRDKELKEAKNTKNLSDMENPIKGVIYLKRGTDPNKVLRKLLSSTKLRARISYTTRVIINGEPKVLGVRSLLEEWIEFRVGTIQRIHNFRLNKALGQEHSLEAWEKIDVGIVDVANKIASSSEEEANEYLQSEYGLDEGQAAEILDMKIKDLTINRVKSKRDQLEKVRSYIIELKSVLESREVKESIIITELTNIMNKYGTQRKTRTAEFIENEEEEAQEEDIIEDIEVEVAVTNKGYVKRLLSETDIFMVEQNPDDEIVQRIKCSNKDTLLVFTYDGYCHKVPVCSIDGTHGKFKDFLNNMIDNESNSEIMAVRPSMDFTGNLKVVYDNGKGTVVYFNRFSGKRKKYANAFSGGGPNSVFVCPSNKFFMITSARRAAYIDTSLFAQLGVRTFRIARVGNDESVFGLQSEYKVPDMNSIDLDRYSKGYCVKIKTDKLW